MYRLTEFLAIAFVLLLVQPRAAGRDITFSTAKSFASGMSNPACIATGDFNNDGYPDVAITDHFNNLAIFLGNGDGTFKAPTLYTLDFYVQGCVAAADFNNDHNVDLAVVGGGHGLAVLVGRGDGTFNNPVYTNTFLGGASVSLAVADLNNDGALDIFVGGNGSSEVLLGDGRGNFIDGQVGLPTGFSVALGDFNGDGKLDAATTSPFSQTVSVLLGNGDGTFQPSRDYNTLSQCTAVVAGDFNSDHKPDLAVTIDSAILIFLGNGDGTFTQAGLWNGGNSPVNILAADFNQDGNLDLATPDFAGDGVTLDMGQGSGTFPLSLDIPTGTNPAYVTAADLNHDGSTDLLVANFGDGTISVELNAAGTQVSVVRASEASDAARIVTLAATVRGTVLTSVVPSGSVVFQEGATVLGHARLVRGSATFRIPRLAQGQHLIEAIFSGDAKFNPNQATVVVQVTD